MSSYGTLHSIQSLGIIYSCVSRGTTILAFYSNCQGNFSEVVPQVLSVIPLQETNRLTYTSGDYMFHYVCEEGVVFLCITDDDFERSRAFMFLENIRTKFFDDYGSRIAQLTPYCLNSALREELSTQMEQYSEDSYFTHTGDQNMIRLDTIRVQTLDGVSGEELERLELLESGDNYSLRDFEQHIREGSNICRQCCRRNYRTFVIIYVLISVLAVVISTVIIIIVVADEDRNSH